MVTTPSAPDPDVDSGGGLWSRRHGAVTLANLTVVALAAFDGLGVVAALPDVAEELGGVAWLPWVVTAYLASSAIAVVLAGPVIDAVGVRRTFRVTAMWFLVTSAAAAVAPSMPLLVAARALQGLGGGLVIAVALASVGLAYPPRLRPRAFAANSMVWGLMGFGGPAVAGLILAAGSWRWVFALQLPLTAFAIAAGWSSLPSTRSRPVRLRVDVVGVLWWSLLVGASLVAVSEIGRRWWSVALAILLAVLAVGASWRRAGRVTDPVVRRHHLSGSPLRWIHITTGAVLVAGLAADNYLPLYVRVTRGGSESFAAFSLMFLTVGWTVGAFVFSRRASRWGETRAAVFGTSLMAPAGALAGVGILLDAPLAVVFGAFALMGIAIGLTSTAGLTLMQSVTSPEEMGRVTSTHQFIRTVAITFSVAIGGALLLGVVGSRTGDVEAVRAALSEGSGDAVGELGGEVANAIGDGLVAVTGFSVVVGLVAVLAARRLRRESSRSGPAGLEVSSSS